MTNLRYALRSLARSPGFVAVSVAALGVGLGLSTTMFGVLDAVIHPYTAFREPDRLFTLNWWFGRRNPMTPPELYRYFRDNTRSFAGVVPTVRNDRMSLERGGAPEDVWVTRVTPGWFTLMGVRPSQGRAFTAGDGEDVVVLSADLARRLLGGRLRPGASVTLNGRGFSVVGVMPRGAGGSGAWLPLPPTVETTNTSLFVRPTVRLKDGVTRAQADAELKVLARLLTDRFGAHEAPFAFEMYPVLNRREEVRDLHKAMVGSALAVLLIACVNLAHLMLARGLAKRRELALRMALGATRAAVVRQMFTECLVITAGGIALGALIAVWGSDVLQNRIPREVQWLGLLKPQLSWRVFAMATLAAGLSAVLFGLIPAIRIVTGVSLDEPLKDDAGTTTGRSRRRHDPLVMAEVALALVLMMGGALLLRTVYQLQRASRDSALDTRTLVTAWIGVRRDADSAGTSVRRHELLAAAAAVPGIRDVALETYGRVPGGAITAELTQDSNRTISMLSYPLVTPNYVRVMGLPILHGRDFQVGDELGAGVAIVDPIAAQRLYPGENAVGRMLKLGGPMHDAPWVPIIGVMRSPQILEAAARFAPNPTVLVVRADTRAAGRLLVRTVTPDPQAVTRLQTMLRGLPGVAWSGAMPFDYARESEIASRAFLARMFVAMGAVALGLAVLGLYGVLAYAVSRRMREFAVRIALGAEPRSLVRMVLHDGFVMVLAGIGIGAFVALSATRWLDAVLIAVLPSDVTSLVVCEAVLVAAGLAAALGPARRAARANPMEILRAS